MWKDLWENRKELLTARYKPKTGEIVGAKTGSPYYLHELGHKNQPKFFSTINDICILMGAPAIVLFLVSFLVQSYQFIWFLAGILVILVLILGYIELDAWLYAFRHYKKN